MAPKIPFTEEQIRRYSRHIILQEVGGKGQKALLASRVLIVGAGGLGSPAALYLAAAGIGTLGIIDADAVDLSNLQRQVLHSTKDLERPKVFSAQERLQALNPDVQVIPYPIKLSAENARGIIEGYDLVIEGSDNFPTKFLVNDACVMLNKPLVMAGLLRFEGQLYVIRPRQGPCYRCIFRHPPPPGLIPSCQEAGVLGAVAGVLGTLQAVEGLRLLLGLGEPAPGILFFDALGGGFKAVSARRDPDCPVCSDHPTITELFEEGATCEMSPGS
jgi:adenylyltransferase/sulfurtransferase